MNISDKLDIISDTDVDTDENNDSPNGNKKDDSSEKPKTPEKVNSADLKSVKMAMPQYNSEATSGNDKSKNASKLPKPCFRILSEYESETQDAPQRTSSYYRYIERPSDDLEDEVSAGGCIGNVMQIICNVRAMLLAARHFLPLFGVKCKRIKTTL